MQYLTLFGDGVCLFFTSCCSYIVNMKVLNYVTNVASKTSQSYYTLSGCSKHPQDSLFHGSVTISCVQYVGYWAGLCHDSGRANIINLC